MHEYNLENERQIYRLSIHLWAYVKYEEGQRKPLRWQKSNNISTNGTNKNCKQYEMDETISILCACAVMLYGAML